MKPPQEIMNALEFFQPAANNTQKGAEVTVSKNLVRNGVFVYIPSHFFNTP